MADAADLMTSIINEQGTSGGTDNGSASSLPDNSSAPALNPPDVSLPASATPGEPAVTSEGAGAAPAETGEDNPNWYEQLLAEKEDDPIRGLLLDDTAWGALRSNPQQLVEWATNARTQFQQWVEREEELKAQEADFEHFGGRKNAGWASRLAGDLFRGEEELPEEEAMRSGANGPRTYAERAIHTLLADQNTSRVAAELGAAVLNRMPSLLKGNEDYLLHVLGYDPKFKDDFKNVMQAGGYKPQADQGEVRQWFTSNNVSPDLLDAFNKQPAKIQRDILQGDVEASIHHLKREKTFFDREEAESRQAREFETQRDQEVTQRTTRDLAMNTSKVYEDYVKKGVDLGLSPLEAAGAAAIAYKAIELGYWEPETESRRMFDNWFSQIKDGNKFQSDLSEKTYKKTFETEWRKALGQHQPKRKPPVPANPNAPRTVTPPNGNQLPHFQPTEAPNNGTQAMSPEDRMNQILREFGAVR